MRDPWDRRALLAEVDRLTEQVATQARALRAGRTLAERLRAALTGEDDSNA